MSDEITKRYGSIEIELTPNGMWIKEYSDDGSLSDLTFRSATEIELTGV